jgi:hypothetical protein
MEVRELPAPTDGKGRVETGATRFGDDWPGVFIRGDNAMYYGRLLYRLLESIPKDQSFYDSAYLYVLYDLVEELQSCEAKD